MRDKKGFNLKKVLLSVLTICLLLPFLANAGDFGIDIIENTHLSLTVQNILDNKHTEFVGGAEIGRLAVMRVSQNF